LLDAVVDVVDYLLVNPGDKSFVYDLRIYLASFFFVSYTKSTAYWLLIQSHIPSQAIMRKSCSGLIGSTIISGQLVTRNSSGYLFTFLYSQSPIALDTAIIPLTLPSSTNPPPLSTLLFSPGKSGL
jgi:hypothetical protein